MSNQSETPDAPLPPDPSGKLQLRLMLAGNYLFSRSYHHVTVQTPSPLPKRGPAILVCNHVSGLDPLLVQSASPRLITWMMAKEYYEVPSLAWVYKAVEAIPVERRGRDLAATRAALRGLQGGRILGIFPEGKIAPTHELLPFQTGVALLAVKSKAPVFPAYLDGTQRGKEMVPAVSSPNRAFLRFGPRVQINYDRSDRENLDHATAQIRLAIRRLQIAGIEAYNCDRR